MSHPSRPTLTEGLTRAEARALLDLVAERDRAPGYRSSVGRALVRKGLAEVREDRLGHPVLAASRWGRHVASRIRRAQL